MEQINYNGLQWGKKRIAAHIDNLLELGVRLIMINAAYRKKLAPSDKDVERIIKSAITKPTKRKSKIKPFAEWTEQERIALFSKNRELIRRGEIHNISNNEIQDFSDYDIEEQKSLRNFADACFLIALLYLPYCYENDGNIESLRGLEYLDNTISKKSNEAIGYWTLKVNKAMSYVNSQGQNSIEIGQCNIGIAKDVLKKYGGVEAYDALSRGKGKKEIREAIEKAIKAKDEKSVYNILNKIRNL
ncbi:MAG: hypothetical protein APR62_05205 [Smithella sp. SDB]|nr:MAG: hypothetical protein APR62_05205 [Smithella sp. SDB]